MKYGTFAWGKNNEKSELKSAWKMGSKNIFYKPFPVCQLLISLPLVLNQNPVFKMKTFLKIVAAVLIVSSTVTFTSCSKSSYSHQFHAKSRGSSTSIDPLSRKSQPVRKKYIINNKRRRILGNETPSIR